MKNSKLSKVLLLVVMVVVMMGVAVQSFAADDPNVTVISPNGTSTTTDNNTATTGNNTLSNVTAPTNITSSNTTSVNTANTSSYNNTDLPKTGVEDYTMLFILIGVCAVAAIYAYKKVNDYKNIK